MSPTTRRRFAMGTAFIVAAASTSTGTSSAIKPNPLPTAFVRHSPRRVVRPLPLTSNTALGLQPPDKSTDASKKTQLDLYVEDQVASPGVSSPSTAIEEYVKARGGNLPIKKVLIANNGMAATKSILSMRQWAYWNLEMSMPSSSSPWPRPKIIKANAEFVRLADSFVEVPGGKNVNNYANVDVITKVAKEQGVDAVWPGWGHASENPKLPNTLSAMGIKFIGPTSPVMSVLGDKIAANILAQTAGMSSIPWSGSYGGHNDGPLEANLTEEGTIPDETFEKGYLPLCRGGRSRPPRRLATRMVS